MPDSITSALTHAPGAAERLAFVEGDDDPAEVEVVPWNGPQRGWVMVPGEREHESPTPDDVIAYLPPPDAPLVKGRTAMLGDAIGCGLVHWAHYLSIVRRASSDPDLAGAIEVELRAGETPALATRRAPDAAGVHEIVEGEPLWVAITMRRWASERIFAGVIVCSQDGNVDVLWPPDGADPALAEETLFIGQNRFEPAYPVVRPDQQSSLYTFKIIACAGIEDAQPPALGALALTATVQEVIDAPFHRHAVSLGRRASTPRWQVWDLVVRVRRGSTAT
jgi:hypothetical protein